MMHTTSASAPCTPPGTSIRDDGNHPGQDSCNYGSSSMHLDSACAVNNVPARPSTSACSHAYGDDSSSSYSEHSARTSLSAASSSPFISLPRSLSPGAVQAPIPTSSSSSSPSSLHDNHVHEHDDPPANAHPLDPTASTPSMSPALSQLPPTVLHELIASATSNLYVRGLPTHISDSHLFSLCSPHGHVLSAKSIVDLRTGQCKGYGFVLFARPHDAVAAMLFINKNPYVLGGPGLQASMARESFSAKLKVLQDDESANVYLSNLPLDMDEQGLIELLKPVHALSVRILVGPTGVSRGVGFARLANRDAASQTIAILNRLTLEPGLAPLQVRFADSPAQKMLKAVTCPPPPRKGPPGPARPCAGEMPPRPIRSKSHPAPPMQRGGRVGPALPAAGRVRRVGSESANAGYATGSPGAVARSVVQSVMGNGRASGATSVPRPNHSGHGHGRHLSLGSWEKSGAASQQERGRTMHRRMHASAPNGFQSASSQQAPYTNTVATSTHHLTQFPPTTPTNQQTQQQPGMYFIPSYPTPNPSMHDPTTGFPLQMPMTLIPPHAPDAPPMYFVAMDPTSSTHPTGTSTPCHIAYAAVDQYGQPIMTWAMPCTAITAPPPLPLPQPIQSAAVPLSPVASPAPMSPPALAPWSSAAAGGSAHVVSSPPAGPPVLTSASSMDDLMLPSMTEGAGGMASVKEEGDETGGEVVTKPRAKSFSVSMLMDAGGAGSLGHAGSGV